MMNESRPTRAEVTDITNAILDGADALLLSGETAIGKHPGEATTSMARIATVADQYRKQAEGSLWKPPSVFRAVSGEDALETAPSSGDEKGRETREYQHNLIDALCQAPKAGRGMTSILVWPKSLRSKSSLSRGQA